MAPLPLAMMTWPLVAPANRCSAGSDISEERKSFSVTSHSLSRSHGHMVRTTFTTPAFAIELASQTISLAANTSQAALMMMVLLLQRQTRKFMQHTRGEKKKKSGAMSAIGRIVRAAAGFEKCLARERPAAPMLFSPGCSSSSTRTSAVRSTWSSGSSRGSELSWQQQSRKTERYYSPADRKKHGRRRPLAAPMASTGSRCQCCCCCCCRNQISFGERKEVLCSGMLARTHAHVISAGRHAVGLSL